MERSRGGSLSMDVWQRAFTVIGRDLALVPRRDPLGELEDGGTSDRRSW